MKLPAPVRNAVSVSGTVVSDATGQPIEGALLSLELTPAAALLSLLGDNSSAGIEPVLTDRAGRFEFPQVEENSYNLRVFHRQFHPVERAQNTNGTPLLVRAGSQLDQFLIRLLPAARLEGRVTSSAGTPLTGVRIELFEMSQSSSGLRSQIASADNGSYNFDGLIPGRYVIQANSTESAQPALFFASAFTISTAETRPLDLSLSANDGYSVSGRFLSDGHFRVRVAEWSLRTTRLPDISNRLSTVTMERMQIFDSPVFTVSNLQPGVHRLTARAETSDGAEICGVVEVVVSNRAVEEVLIPISSCQR